MGRLLNPRNIERTAANHFYTENTGHNVGVVAHLFIVGKVASAFAMKRFQCYDGAVTVMENVEHKMENAHHTENTTENVHHILETKMENFHYHTGNKGMIEIPLSCVV